MVLDNYLNGQQNAIVSAVDLGSRLRKLREGLGLSLRDVSETTRISAGHLSLIENGRVRSPSPSILQRLANAYNFKAEDLLVLAGYITSPESDRTQAHARIALATMKDLSTGEIDEVQSFISYLRQRRHSGRRGNKK
jgi:transcriptional regulator with XRE-family HTH domain